MVRSAVDRAFLPAKSLFEQVGDMMILTARAVEALCSKGAGNIARTLLTPIGVRISHIRGFFGLTRPQRLWVAHDPPIP